MGKRVHIVKVPLVLAWSCKQRMMNLYGNKLKVSGWLEGQTLVSFLEPQFHPTHSPSTARSLMTPEGNCLTVTVYSLPICHSNTIAFLSSTFLARGSACMRTHAHIPCMHPMTDVQWTVLSPRLGCCYWGFCTSCSWSFLASGCCSASPSASSSEASHSHLWPPQGNLFPTASFPVTSPNLVVSSWWTHNSVVGYKSLLASSFKEAAESGQVC